MNEEQILHFRKILNAWHEQIVEEASRTVAHMQDEVTNFPILQTEQLKKRNLV